MAFTVMADVPNPLFDANGDPYSGAVLKAYEPGTTTPISIYIDENGSSPQATLTANAQGKWEVSGNEILPYIDRKHKWGIFANATDAAADTPFYMGPFDDVGQSASASDSALIKNFPTLADAVADTGLVDGDALNIAERTTGNGGGAMWDVVLSTTVTENTYNIVQCTGVVTLSLVLRADDFVEVKAAGALGGTDSTSAVQACIDLGVRVVVGESSADYIIDTATLNNNNQEMVFEEGAGFISPSGAVGIPISITGNNVTLRNASIDGNKASATNERELVNVSGNDVKIYDLSGKNSTRHVLFIDGGDRCVAKNVRGEDCNKDVVQIIRADDTTIIGITGINSRYACEIQEDTNRTSVYDIKATGCNRPLEFLTHAGATVPYKNVVIDGIYANGCVKGIGTVNAEPTLDNRNVTIRNFSGEGWTDLTQDLVLLFGIDALRLEDFTIEGRDSATGHQFFFAGCDDVLIQGIDYDVTGVTDQHLRFQDCDNVEIVSGKVRSGGKEFIQWESTSGNHGNLNWHDQFLELTTTDNNIQLTGPGTYSGIVVTNVPEVNSYANRLTVDTAITYKDIPSVTPRSGSATFSGTGAQTDFDISISALAVPSSYTVNPTSPAASTDYHISVVNSAIIRIAFAVAPASGTDNVTFDWSIEL